MSQLWRRRFYRTLASIYLYNEERGATQLGVLLESFTRQFPDEVEMQTAIRKHQADERRHGLMFRAYLQRRGWSPLQVGPSLGYIDLLVHHVFGTTLEQLEARRLVENPIALHRLCRLIEITEARGLRQVRWLLNWAWVREDAELYRIFRVIERDEPSHFLPYRAWRARAGAAGVGVPERWADFCVHWGILLFRYPWFVARARQPETLA